MDQLNGAWEPRLSVGPRVEIDGDRFLRLWKGGVVLDTTFTAEKTDGGLLLRLAENGLRYAPAQEPYAVIRECRFADGALILTDDFPISGESVEELYPTQKSRWGDVTILGDVLPRLAGTWTSPSGDWAALRFSGDRLTWNGQTVSVLAACRNGDPSGDIRIIDRDPAREFLFGFSSLVLRGETLHASVFVCDGPSIEFTFTKTTEGD